MKLTTVIISAGGLMIAYLFSGCVGVPKGVKPVQGFELDRYLGRWYEIARLDHSFERGLSHVTADYSLRKGGGVRVLNRGYSESKKEWKSAEGKAFFVKSPDQGYLKVSFFGPFYGSYVIFELDQKDYQYAVICGPKKSYFWILARKPEIEPELKNKLISQAAALGFDTTKLIFPDQMSPPL
ncbi:MAG TPA: lipocalin family protein [Candidatus Paceibacterota bacterium]|nr:lipocalin family protein [Verrucomicrobiota bacterium]HSA09633.1 lipocalin family protein [Candidatus Paceibacterota bacterium]